MVHVYSRLPSRPAVVTNDTLLEEKRVPAALNLPYGHLFFGYAVDRLHVPVSRNHREEEPNESPPGTTAFQGQGHTLWSRPSADTSTQSDVIEIDSD